MVIIVQNMKQKPGYRQTEVGIIPEDWKIEKLGDCLLGSPQYGVNAPATPYKDNLPIYIRITDITEDGYFSPENIASVKHVDGEKYVLKLGDLVFARTGASVGKTYLYRPQDGILVFAGYLIRVKVNPSKLVPYYLASYVKTGNYGNWVKLMSMRSGQPGINGNEYAQLPIPLPPLPEQQAIATALSDVDALIASLDRLIAKKRDIKQATMQQLLTGRTRLPGFSGETKTAYKQTEAGEIPEYWKVIKLGEVADIKTGPFGSALHEKDYVDDGTPIITVEHLSEQGVVHANLPMVSEYDRNRLKVYSLLRGDIVFSRVGSVDRNSLITEAESGWLFSGRLLRIRLQKLNVYAPFLSYYLNQESTKQRIRTIAVGQTMASLNTQLLKNIDIAFPPTLSEQQAIAAVLSDMDAEIVALERKREKTRALKQAMMQELLTGKTRLL